MDRGKVVDWEDMEKVWDYCYSRALEIRHQPEEYPLIMTDGAFTGKVQRERISQTMFETFNVPSLYFGTQGVLSMYGYGRSTGLILHPGDGTTLTTPIYEGTLLSHAMTHAPWGGRDVTDYLLA
jgi:actin-related protein